MTTVLIKPLRVLSPFDGWPDQGHVVPLKSPLVPKFRDTEFLKAKTMKTIIYIKVRTGSE